MHTILKILINTCWGRTKLPVFLRWFDGMAGAGKDGAGRDGAALEGRRFPALPLLTETTVLRGPTNKRFLLFGLFMYIVLNKLRKQKRFDVP